MALYKFVQVFRGKKLLGDQPATKPDSFTWEFEITDDIHPQYPTLFVIRTKSVNFSKIRVQLRLAAIGYLTPDKSVHVLQYHEGMGLQKGTNELTITTTDVWGDRKSVSNVNVDDIEILQIEVGYRAR